MKKLYFVRHGLTEMNVEGRWSGTTETPLAAEGRRQATEAGKAAKKLKVDLIVASPMTRAHDTAKLIAKEIAYPLDRIELNALLIERHYGELEGKAWYPDFNYDGIVDIETEDTLLHRARLALNWLESLEHDSIMVVSHGAFGRALRHHILKDFPFNHPHKLKNAEIQEWL